MISTQDPSARDRAGLYDINATDDAGATALIYAARAGYVGVIKQLLAHGASATKVPVVANRVKRRSCLEHPE